jgi:hypothetical protein
MNKIVIVLCAMSLIVTAIAFGEALPDENAAKDLAVKVMTKVAVGDLDAAFLMMKPYVPLSPTEIDSIAIQSKSMREQYGKRYGSSIGYEFIDSKKVGDSLLRLRYIEKTDKHVLPWVFYFYKTNEGWILNSFNWNDVYTMLFNDEAK